MRNGEYLMKPSPIALVRRKGAEVTGAGRAFAEICRGCFGRRPTKGQITC